MSISSLFIIVLLSGLITINAQTTCTFDSDCSTNSYCPSLSGTCQPSLSIGSTCNNFKFGTKQCLNSFCYSATNDMEGICTAKYANGRTCDFGDECSSGYCSTISKTCQVNIIERTCSFDSECSTNYYCTKFPNGICARSLSVGSTCDATMTTERQCSVGSFCHSSTDTSTATCTAKYANGRTCTTGNECSSNHCATDTKTCQVNPFEKAFTDAAKGAAIALTTIIILVITIPIGICIAICACCYFCGRRQPVIVNNQQPKVMVASVPMGQVQQQYYASSPTQQQQWIQPSPQQGTQYNAGGNNYQPLQYNQPQGQNDLNKPTVDGTTYV